MRLHWLLAILLLTPVAKAQVAPVALMLPGLPDPVPIQRLPLDTGKMPPAKEAFVSLPRTEFEHRVQAAAINSGVLPARVSTAKYTSKLIGTDLIGDGIWQIAVATPTTLPIEPLNVALSAPKWEDGTSASLVRAESTRLIIDEARRTSLAFAWSARGRDEPGSIRFDLKLPAAPIASLDLDLPHGRTVSANDALVVGPTASAPTRWRIVFSGTSRLELTVHDPSATFRHAIRSNRSARFELGIAQAAAYFEFDLESLRGPTGQWHFRVDPDVRVLDVITPPRATWAFDSSSREVTVSLAEPLIAGRISFAAAIPVTDRPWSTPCIHSLGVTGEDLLEMRIASGLKLDDWMPGDYALLRTAPLPDRGYALYFRGSWRTGEFQRKPPVLHVQTAAPELAANVMFDWQPGESRNWLRTNLKLTVLRGPVTQFGLKLPAGYHASTFRLIPDDAAADVTANAGKWTIEPARPWTTGQTIELLLDLRGPPVALTGDHATVTIPQLLPFDPMTWNGTLTIESGSAIRIEPPPGFKPLGEGKFQCPVSTREMDATVSLRRAPPPEAPPPLKTASLPLAWLCKDVSAVATLDSTNEILVRLQGIVEQAADHRLPVVLPLQARVESVAIGGQWANIEKDGNTLYLPMPSRNPVAFDVSYRVPNFVCGLVTELPNVFPNIPGIAIERMSWNSTGDYLFGWYLASSSDSASGFSVHRALPAAVLVLGCIGILMLCGFLKRAKRRMKQFSLPALVLASLANISAEPVRTAAVYVRGETVFAPQSLLDRLDQMSGYFHPKVAFTSADIHGREIDGQAVFEILFTLETRSDEALAILPIQGLALESATLDGKAAYPVTSGNRLLLILKGSGPHMIAVTGRVPVRSRGADREVTLQLDPLPVAKMTFIIDRPGHSLTVPSRLGAQAIDGDKVEANLGCSGPVVVRWKQADDAGNSATVSSSELTFWDIAPNESAVTAAFTLRIQDGAISKLDFEVPPALEPGRLQIRGTDIAAAAIRDWRLSQTEGKQIYTVFLQEQLEGTQHVVLKLVPRLPLPVNPQLSAVRLLTATLPSTGFLAVRTATPAERWEHPGYAIEPEPTGLPEFGVDRTGATVFRREILDGTVRPTWNPPSLTRPINDEITWRFGTKAFVEGQAIYTRDSNHYAMEFDVPAAVTVLEVQSPEMAGWSRHGSIVNVWFSSPPRNTTIRWSGEWHAYKPGTLLEVPQAVKNVPWRIVKLQAAEGFSLHQQPNRGWQHVMTLCPNETSLLAPLHSMPLRVLIRKD